MQYENRDLPTSNKHGKSTKSPFVRYCVTVMVCLLIASTGFIFIVYSSEDDIIDDTIIQTAGRNIPYITANTTTKEIIEENFDDDDEDKDAVEEDASQPSQTPNMPGMGGISLSGNCYTDIKASAATSSKPDDYGGGLTLYNGWPWGEGQVTVCDPNAMREQLIRDIAKVLDTTPDDIRARDSLSVDTDNYCSASLINVNSVDCLPLCLYPAWVSKTYYTESWEGAMPKWTTSMADSIYICLVFEDGAGNNWFLPATQSDNKGHTFPGGVAQTFIRATSYSNGTWNAQLANTINGNNPLTLVQDTGKADGDIWSGSLPEILGVYKISGDYSLYYYKGQCRIGFSLETHSNFVQTLRAITKDYKLVGIAVQPK